MSLRILAALSVAALVVIVPVTEASATGHCSTTHTVSDKTDNTNGVKTHTVTDKTVSTSGTTTHTVTTTSKGGSKDTTTKTNTHC